MQLFCFCEGDLDPALCGDGGKWTVPVEEKGEEGFRGLADAARGFRMFSLSWCIMGGRRRRRRGMLLWKGDWRGLISVGYEIRCSLSGWG